jgi:hypothetical protein
METSIKKDCVEKTDAVEIQSGPNPGPGGDRPRKRQNNHRGPNESGLKHSPVLTRCIPKA